ncbi:nuclear matrix constituent protein 1 isoform X1 [Prosopis cineraria]|uniref:nuclear matrix constituent protein 1 isoform X1 n=1 Tax=Prosopis cineraria TaxID=364024 RepID=UPI0024108C8F|nr:nuclear matrix constituent protein 1 isoform X1 [Prosopis cineraria]
MEDYLQYMKALRFQMNDVEDQAAKISAEEEMKLTNVRILEKDIESAKSEMRQLREDIETMRKAKGEICSKILEKQRKISSLESDSSTLSQTLELIQQERLGLSNKLEEKRSYYRMVEEDMAARLQQQKEWISSKKNSRQVKEHELVKGKGDGPRSISAGEAIADNNFIMDNAASDAMKRLQIQLDSAKARLDEILLLKSNLFAENNRMRQAIEEAKYRINTCKSEIKEADITALEEEYNALMSDKAGEIEYLRSLEEQVEKIKGIHHAVKCACGEEYTLAVSR